MKTYTFDNRFEKVADIPFGALDIVEDEPMLYSADLLFASNHGGPITRQIIHKLYNLGAVSSVIRNGEKWNWIIDTKTVMLMPGMYPCIPGWHADAVPRGDNGQPDLEQLDNPSEHYIAVVDNTHANTQVLGKDTIDVPAHFIDENHVWQSLSGVIKAGISTPPIHLENCAIHKFGSSCLHRGSFAKTRGWRFFFRMSLMRGEPHNKIRRQVNVYTDVNGGW